MSLSGQNRAPLSPNEHTHTHTVHRYSCTPVSDMSTHIHTRSTDTAVSDIVEAFHSFSQRSDIGIILINQNVSHMMSHDPIVDHMIPSPLETDSGDDSPPAGRT